MQLISSNNKRQPFERVLACAWFLILLACLNVGFMKAGSASEIPASYALDHIDTDAGLPQNAVRGILVDKDGFLWAGTEKGLARYDGNRFINFSELVPDIPEDVSLGLQLDSQNRIWTSWFTHSLQVLAANRQDVIKFEPPEGFPLDLRQRGFPRIVETSSGDIWFPGRVHVYRLGTDDTVISIHLESLIISNGIEIGDQVVYGTLTGLVLIDTKTLQTEFVSVPVSAEPLFAGSGSTVMVAQNNGMVSFCHVSGIFNYNPKTRHLKRLDVDSDTVISRCKRLGSDLLVNRMKPSSEFFSLDILNTNTEEFVDTLSGLPESGANSNGLGLYDVFTDSRQNRWVLMGDSLYQAEGSNGRFRQLDLPSRPFGQETIFAEDQSGAVWVRTDDFGLARFSRYSKRFQTTVPPSSLSPSSNISTVAVDQHNNVWLAADERVLLYWNRQNDTWVDKLPGNKATIKGIEILADGSVCVSIPLLSKIIVYSPEQDAWTREHNIAAPLASGFSQTREGKLLISSAHQIFTIDPHSGKKELLHEGKIGGNHRAFEQDNSGNTWLGTHETGLVRISASGDVKYWNRGNSGLSSDKIFALHFTKNGLLWIGTWHGGLLSFDTLTQQFTHYGVEEGLPDTTVFGILEDEKGMLWLSTYAGLTRFEPCTSTAGCQPEIVNFDKRDGLQGNEFDADSHVRSQRGELFFTGTGGLNAFYPDTIDINHRPPSVIVSRAQLNGLPLPGAESEFVFPDTVYLSYGAGELRLEVSVLDFNNPKKNKLQYRETQKDASWRNLEQAFLDIRELSVGTHVFEFRGSNNDGVWSNNTAALKFEVSPPFYRHPLMVAFYLLLSMLIPLLYFRNKQLRLVETQKSLRNKVAKRTQELELANSSRERFFANVSHEILSPVHMILLMLENHMGSTANEDKQLYKSATGYAAQLMVYLKQLVSEARSHEVDSHLYAADIGDIINGLVSINQPVATSRSISLNVSAMPKQRVAFYRSSAISIFSNLLCNALIYTPENGSIHIDGKVSGGNYSFSFTNMISEEQATDIKSFFDRGVRGSFNANYFGGHGLGLSIVTSAVEALGGDIDVSLKDEYNIVFSVVLPLADPSMPDLPDAEDMAFSYEQMLAIKLISDRKQPSLARAKPMHDISVLVIEDDLLVANMLSQTLSQSYNVYVAATSSDGVRMARIHQPDVIFCDLFLPDESGFEVLKAIRANRMTMDAFFVMVTASISEEDKLRCQELGVDRFVRKPFSAENLRLLIKNHMKLSEQRFEHRRQETLIKRARVQKVQNKRSSFKARFDEALEELYQDPETTIDIIQLRLSMSYAALMRNCKKSFGKSPKRLLIEKRIEVAKYLLTTSEYKIGLIAELAGFSTHSQFAIVFRRETGMTPASYRKDPTTGNGASL